MFNEKSKNSSKFMLESHEIPTTNKYYLRVKIMIPVTNNLIGE